VSDDTQDTVLFNEIAEYVSVLAVQRPGEDAQASSS
jgi:hypothetical protein